MVSVRLILPANPDYPTRLAAEQLRLGLADDFQIELVRLREEGFWHALRTSAVLRGRATPQVTHVWGLTALATALIGGPFDGAQGGSPVVYGASAAPRAAEAQWLRAASVYRNIVPVCQTDSARRILVRRGMAYEQCQLIRPGVEFARVSARRDPVLRAALGCAADDRVLLIAGEMTRFSGHDKSILAAALLHLLDPRYRLLLWDRGSRRDATMRYAKAMGLGNLLVRTAGAIRRDAEFEELLPVADIVISAAEADGQTLALCMAQAAGLPVVAAVAPAVAEVLEDRHNALLVTRAGAPELARRVMDLDADAGLQASISRQGRDDAYEFFSLTKMLDAYRALYRQVAGDAGAEFVNSDLPLAALENAENAEIRQE